MPSATTMITVYTAPGCPGCSLTKRHLDRRGIAYDEVPIDDDNREAIAFLGYTSAPVVCAKIDGAEQHWSGYRPDRLDALAKAVEEPARCPVCLSHGYCYLPDRCPNRGLRP